MGGSVIVSLGVVALFLLGWSGLVSVARGRPFPRRDEVGESSRVLTVLVLLLSAVVVVLSLMLKFDARS